MILPIGDDQVKGGYFPIFSYGFILINVAIFIFQSTLNPTQLESFIYTYGSIPKTVMEGKDYYTLFSSIFLHGGLMHLLGNMLYLWIFADNIEATIGNTKFLLFYIIGGLAAHAAHIYFNIDSVIPTVGASGSIAAVMGAYIVMFPKSRIRMLFLFWSFYIPAFLFLGYWIVQEFLSGTAALSVETAESAGIAYWAHIGGFAFGVLAGFFFRSDIKQEPEYPSPMV